MHDAYGDVFDFAADSVEAGITLNGSLIEASQIPTNSLVRNRISNWVSRMSRGQSVPEAARGARLPPLVCGMLATTTHTQDLPHVLRFLGRYYRSRFSRATALIQAGVVPMLAMVMGLFVAWLALSVMLPLVRLIEVLS